MRTAVLRLNFSHLTKTMFENCFQSERVFSCLSNGGMVKSWEQCRKHCESKKMEPFYLNDFYNFGSILNRTNFLHPNLTRVSESRTDIENLDGKYQLITVFLNMGPYSKSDLFNSSGTISKIFVGAHFIIDQKCPLKGQSSLAGYAQSSVPGELNPF